MPEPLTFAVSVFRIGEHVWYVHDGARKRRTSRAGARCDWRRIGLDIALELKRISPLQRHAQTIPVAQQDHPLRRVAQLPHGIDERLEDGVEIERRAADDLEHVRRRRLLREQFLEVARASLHLVEQPRVLDRDHRLIGEGFEQGHVVGIERAGLLAGDADVSGRRASLHQGHEQHRAMAAQARDVAQPLRLVLGLGNLHDLAVAEPRRERELADRARRKRPQRGVGLGVGWRERGEVGDLTLEAPNRRRIAAEQALGALGNGLENGRCVGRRGGDDLQDLGGRGLALQRSLRLVEQPHVLDRDHRLVGEGLDDLDLPRRKRTRLGAPQDHHAFDSVVSQQGHAEQGTSLNDCLHGGRILGVLQHVRDAFNPPRKRDASRKRSTARRKRILADQPHNVRVETVARLVKVNVSLANIDRAMRRADQFNRRTDERVEYGLQIERRAADDLEHVRGRRLLRERLLEVARLRLHLLE